MRAEKPTRRRFDVVADRVSVGERDEGAVVDDDVVLELAFGRFLCIVDPESVYPLLTLVRGFVVVIVGVCPISRDCGRKVSEKGF